VKKERRDTPDGLPSAWPMDSASFDGNMQCSPEWIYRELNWAPRILLLSSRTSKVNSLYVPSTHAIAPWIGKLASFS
jgi:hypothetical protein